LTNGNQSVIIIPIITKEDFMFKVFTKVLAVTLVLSTPVMAQGSGSGNPKNDGFYNNKPNPTPVMIWKDGHLVRNPVYFDKDSPYMKK
jgi:hypothetical protein